MSTSLPVLDRVRVASPCRASWEMMEGDDRARFCGECRKHVYNLSGMSRAQAEALIRDRQGETCVRFYRRRDGTMLTRDCPVGRARLRRALVFQVGLIGCFFLAIPGVAGLAQRSRWKEWPLWDEEPYHSVAVKLGFRDQPMIMGMMTAPPRPGSGGG